MPRAAERHGRQIAALRLSLARSGVSFDARAIDRPILSTERVRAFRRLLEAQGLGRRAERLWPAYSGSCSGRTARARDTRASPHGFSWSYLSAELFCSSGALTLLAARVTRTTSTARSKPSFLQDASKPSGLSGDLLREIGPKRTGPGGRTISRFAASLARLTRMVKRNRSTQEGP
jgi:hypothetical protein